MRLTDTDIDRLTRAHFAPKDFARAIEAHVLGEPKTTCAETCRNYEAHADHCPDAPKYMKYIGEGEGSTFIVDESGTVVWSERKLTPVGHNGSRWNWDDISVGWEEVDKLPDPYAELKAAHAEGKVIEFQYAQNSEWVTWGIPYWTFPVGYYRIKAD